MNLTIPEGVTNISIGAFGDCTQLANVRLPTTLKSIGQIAFDHCINLTSLTIPANVTNIDHFAFEQCTALKSVYFLGDAPTFANASTLGFDIFDAAENVTLYYLPGKSGWFDQIANRPAKLWIASDDLDHDSVMNSDEMIAGTDPSDAKSVLRFESQPRPSDLSLEDQTPLSDGQFAVFVQTVPGHRYEVQQSESLGVKPTPLFTFTATGTQKRIALNQPASAVFLRLVALSP